MTIHLFRSVSVVTHKLVELNKTCMAAILKALSIVKNENEKKKYSVYLEFESTVKTLTSIKLLYSCDLHFNVSTKSNVLHSERC